MIKTKTSVLSIAGLICLILAFGCEGNRTISSTNVLPTSTPEAEGVSSAGILQFLNAADEGENEIHSFVIVRHGKKISEGWWEPYGKDLKHVMFSVSKSFTSTGVGIAISENRLELDDRVVSFFPESLPDSLSDYMKEMTVEDLLMMSTGMETDPLFGARDSENWPKAFLSAAVKHEPGTVFRYNNMASFMLSAIVQKATGEKLFDYLMPRLFEPLGIDDVTWDETPEGYTFGAIGLRLKSEDMARFGQMMLEKGEWYGEQIVPATWVEAATSFKIESNDPSNDLPKELNDWKQGYGYQFWRSRNNSYRADGLGGQFILVMPEKDAVVVLTCSASETQEVLNLVWDHLLPAMHDEPLPEDENMSNRLSQKIASLSVSTGTPSHPANTALLSKISGKEIEFTQNETVSEVSLLGGENGDIEFQFERDSTMHSITAGHDNWKSGETRLNSLTPGPGPNRRDQPVKVAAQYSWIDDFTIELTAKFVEESIWSEVWSFRFEEEGDSRKVHLEISGSPPRTLDGFISL